MIETNFSGQKFGIHGDNLIKYAVPGITNR